MKHMTLFLALLTVFALTTTADAARAKKIKTKNSVGNQAVEGIFEYDYKEIMAYNDGVEALIKKKYTEAQLHFQRALMLNDDFPEAHSNLAFALRMRGIDNADASLRHYARALELAPKLAQAYMYRGILYVQLDRMEDAEKDRAALLKLDTDDAKQFAKKLRNVIKRGRAKQSENALSIYGSIAR